MPITAFAHELENTGTYDGKKASWQYLVFAADDKKDARDTVIATAPATYEGLFLDKVEVEETQIHPSDTDRNLHTVTVSYKEVGEGEDPGGGSASYSFSFQATSAHVFLAKEHLRRYGVDENGSLLPMDDPKIPPYNGAINVEQESGGNKKAKGINLPVPPTTNTWNFTANSDVVNDTYQRAVENIMGSVNKFEFQGRPPGSLRFVSCNGSITSTEGIWNITFGFSYEKNVENLAIGDITGIKKNGHELLWAYYENRNDTTSKNIITKPKAVYIERMFDEEDFNVLGF